MDKVSVKVKKHGNPGDMEIDIYADKDNSPHDRLSPLQQGRDFNASMRRGRIRLRERGVPDWVKSLKQFSVWWPQAYAGFSPGYAARNRINNFVHRRLTPWWKKVWLWIKGVFYRMFPKMKPFYGFKPRVSDDLTIDRQYQAFYDSLPWWNKLFRRK